MLRVPARSRCDRPWTKGLKIAVTTTFVLCLALVGRASAGKTGIIARAGTASLAVPSSPSPLVAFLDGAVVDLWPMASWIRAAITDGRALVVHEPESGATYEAPTDAGSIGIQSFEVASSATTLGGLLDEPGAIVRFTSSSAASADPFQAERFEVSYPNGRRSIYAAGPFRTAAVPEPGLASGLAIGIAILGRLARRRPARRAGCE